MYKTPDHTGNAFLSEDDEFLDLKSLLQKLPSVQAPADFEIGLQRRVAASNTWLRRLFPTIIILGYPIPASLYTTLGAIVVLTISLMMYTTNMRQSGNDYVPQTTMENGQFSGTQSTISSNNVPQSPAQSSIAVDTQQYSPVVQRIRKPERGSVIILPDTARMYVPPTSQLRREPIFNPCPKFHGPLGIDSVAILDSLERLDSLKRVYAR